MKLDKKSIFTLFIAFAGIIGMSSCDQEEPVDSPFVEEEGTSDPEDPSPAHSTILLYAVATNNLGINMVYDKNEMVRAASQIDLKHNNVLVFETRFEDLYDYSSKPQISLQKLVKISGDPENEYGWETVKEYDASIASLNPARISEVIDYVVDRYESEKYGLIFWSHSTASHPYEVTKPAETEKAETPQQYSFGVDQIYTSGEEYYQLNVDDLAAVIPDNVFEFIWFDSCYMSNIESIYEMKGKCEYYIGYPTEVCDAGMPYHYTLPYLANKNQDVVEAAKVFFDYYDTEYYYRLATIAVVDMKNIETFADYCQEIYNGVEETPSVTGLFRYTNYRQSSGPFYDLGDYTKKMAELKDASISEEEWNEALDKLVVYKASTPSDFNGNAVDPLKYSGISTHVYKRGENSINENYYESLNWFGRVFTE